MENKISSQIALTSNMKHVNHGHKCHPTLKNASSAWLRGKTPESGYIILKTETDVFFFAQAFLDVATDMFFFRCFGKKIHEAIGIFVHRKGNSHVQRCEAWTRHRSQDRTEKHVAENP